MKLDFLDRWKMSRGLALATLAILAISSRFSLLGHSPFKADTLNFYQAVLRNQNVLELWRNPPWLNQIPLGETLCLLLVKAGLPATPFVTRLPFALMGVLALFFVWHVARRWFGSAAALMVLLLAVLNPYQLYFSRTAYYYSGVICCSAALFLAFWAIKERLQRNELPKKKKLALWVLAAALACHMHMSVWAVVGLQGALLFSFGWKLDPAERKRFFLQLVAGGLLLGAVMSRWIVRAVGMIAQNTQQLGADASSEFLRLLPAYFAGENRFAIGLLFIFIVLSAIALFGARDATRRFRSLAWICALHVAIVMLYVGTTGGGIAKITYFSPIWPHFILLLGVGSYLGIQTLAAKALSPCKGEKDAKGMETTALRWIFFSLLIGSYIALTAAPDWAILHLEGAPQAYYKINNWVLKNLPNGTPILTDRWYHPWNELAVHNPGNIHYTFTVPDEPIETYKRLNWPKTVEEFYEKYPEAAFLEISRGRYEQDLGPWTFPQTHFARCASITNEPALVLRRWKVFPDGVYTANDGINRIFYNTTDDLVAATRRAGRDVLRLYGEGWGYAKPGWQQGDFQDYRILNQSAAMDCYNLKDTPLSGALEISAATADKPKPISANGNTTVFASGRIRTWSIPLTLHSGKNALSFTSPSADPLFVLDIRWKPKRP